MSKIAPFIFAGVGATATSVGGVYLIKGTSPVPGPKEQKKEEITPELMESIDAFKEKKGDKCVHGLFGTDVEMKNKSGSSEISGDSADYFGSAPSEASEDTKGCLIINWKKTTYSTSPDGGKWKGTFTWSWSFKNKTKGFINFNVAKAIEGGNKLGITGVFYLLEKKADQGNKWEIKKHKEVTTDKEIDSTKFDENFPKVKSELPEVGTNQNYLGFVGGKGDLGNICGTGGCTTTPKPESVAKQWMWNWNAKGTHKIGEWSPDLKWWEHTYDKSTFDLPNKLSGFTGTWTNVAKSK